MLKVIWIESGLAWVPFMMQRLNHEYLMRQSDAPLLKRLPSEYIADIYFTSQPLEVTIPHMLESTFKAVRAETQLMYSSDLAALGRCAGANRETALFERTGEAQHPRRDRAKAVSPLVGWP